MKLQPVTVRLEMRREWEGTTVASWTPVIDMGSAGALNLRSPSGGAAKRIPRNSLTPEVRAMPSYCAYPRSTTGELPDLACNGKVTATFANARKTTVQAKGFNEDIIKDYGSREHMHFMRVK